MQRGKKQSLFIGRRVPEVGEDGTPVLYRRYTKVEDILVKDDAAAVTGAGGEAAGERTAQPASTSGADEQDTSSKKGKKQKRQREEAAAVPGTAEEAAAVAEAPAADGGANGAAPPAAKKPKKEKKAKKAAAEQQQNGGTPPAQAQQEQLQQQEEQQAAVAGNADEATKIRSVFGFSAASSKAAPSFDFGFSVEAQVAAETEQKLARIRMADSADSEGYIPRRVFVGGMPYSCDEAAIREYWGWCGDIESLDMLTFPDTGRFRGIAFITFTTEEGYTKALAYDGEQVDGQTLRVDRCKAATKKGRNAAPITPNGTSNTAAASPAANGNNSNTGAGPQQNRGAAPKTPGYNVAYVGNIAFEVTTEELQGLFKEAGATRVRLHTDKETGKPKGFAHVHFDSEEALDRALELDGTELQGRNIKIGYAQPKK